MAVLIFYYITSSVLVKAVHCYSLCKQTSKNRALAASYIKNHPVPRIMGSA